ncbi:MAG: hypothetical protein RLZZ450_994 [Pseudomonadota bacterium]|jgi:tetratricopeptide (TPR) repeat protein/predicted Ser/Thr protein kinase
MSGLQAVPHAVVRAEEAIPEAARLYPGELLADRFLIECLAGVGGMGAVYKAKDLATKGFAAIKIVGKPRENDVERFAREAAVLSELSHPAIVRYIAHGLTSRGAPFLAMEWLDGHELSVALRHGGLRVEQSLVLMHRICGALALAHARGVVHRDLKPSNVFLVDGDAARAQLLDFGLARHESRTGSLTRAGSMLGTVGYMAPEQAMGASDVNARADVFALGCVLYECLTGRAAFSGQHDVAVLAKVLRQDPPKVSALRPDLGTHFDALFDGLLAKDPDARPRDAGVVLRILDALGSVQGIAPSGSPTIELLPVTRPEHRIVSVILGRTRDCAVVTRAPEDTAHETAALEQLTRRFGAEPAPLQHGGLLLVLAARDAVTASDQAVQAARCALCLSRLRPDLALSVATGRIDRASTIPVGAAIDEAAALLHGAEGSAPEIALDELTAGLLSSRFEVRKTAAGLALLRELEDSDAPRLLMGRVTPCVGRDKELGLLEATLAECSEDSVARAVLVTAPPGIGKSRLGREYLARAAETARVIVARADPMAPGSPLCLAQRLVRAAAGVSESDTPRAQRTLLERYLTTLFDSGKEPALEFLSDLIGVAADEPASARMQAARSDPEVMREQTQRAFVNWLDAEARQRPLVVLLDDLHWGDLPSVSYVEETLHALSDRPIMVVALARPEVHEQFPRLWQRVGVQEVRLKGLTRRSSERLARSLLAEQTPDSIIARVVELADGNAFFLEELIRRVAEGGTDFPQTVLAIVQSRLERLDPQARRALSAASTFGETFWVDGVRALLSAKSELRACFESLAREELVVRRPDARFRDHVEYTFRHAFVRDAAYEMTDEGERRSAHAKAGAWLESVGERDALLLADHFELGGLPSRATGWVVEAALAALEGGDWDRALVLSQRGVRLGATGHQRGELLLIRAYGSLWGTTNDIEGLAGALSSFPEGSTEWWLAISVLIYGTSMLSMSEQADAYGELAKQAPLPSELHGVTGQALHALTSAAVLMGKRELCWPMIDRVLLVATDPRGADSGFLAWYNLARCEVAYTNLADGVWRLEHALAWGRESERAMIANGSPSGHASTLFHRAMALRMVGQYQESARLMLESASLGEKSNNVLIKVYAELILLSRDLQKGRGARHQQRLQTLARSPNASIVQNVASVLADAAYRAGDFVGALDHAAQAAAGPTLLFQQTARWTLARTYLALSRPEQSLAEVDSALLSGSQGAYPHFTVDFLNCRALAQSALGQSDAAYQSLRRASRFVREVASTIHDSHLRASYLDNVHAHRTMRELAAQWQAHSGGDPV